ncbi:MAG TPA: ATP-binding protein [Terriglobales bacterium]|nr:ATP-binding protein [Terriglobales bacterium]
MLENQTQLMTGFRLSRSSRYVICIAVLSAATIVRWLLNPVLKTELPYIVLYFAIMLIAWIGGLGPAVLGVVLGIVSANYLFIAPQHAWFRSIGLHDLVTTLLFAFIGIATGGMSEVYGRALTESREAYKLSQDRQFELEYIYSSAPVGLAFVDENLRYLRVNDDFAALNGAPARDHFGKSLSDILPATAVELLTPLVRKVLTTHTPLVDYEIQAEAPPGSGELRYMKLSFYPVQIGELRGVHAVIEDVTAARRTELELKSLEQQLQHAVKMEAIGRLAGGVAHDFNNLLMVISSYTELLLQQLEHDPAMARKLHAIAGATQRAARLTRQLLAFSRKQTLQAQVLEFDSLVANSEPLLRRVLHEDIDLILELDCAKAKVKIDPAQFEHVLMNLTLNSRDAMASKGRLVLQTACRRFYEESVRSLFTLPAGAYVKMSITDSGRGMSPEVQARIFDPFFTTKEPGQGTGLGLAMVYGIVKQSGGYIEVNSEVGGGTTFHIWLPIVEERVEELGREPSSGQSVGATILLVEDETILRQAISESLSALGYCVLEAPDGARAIEIMDKEGSTVDLVLSDAVMPRIGGAELIQHLRARRPGMRAILMSGYTHAHSVGAGSAGEPDPDIVVLQKPFAHAELAKIIRKLLSNSLQA